jgi:hypothetical protein
LEVWLEDRGHLGEEQNRRQDPKVGSTQPVLGKAGDMGREEEKEL